MDNITDYLSDTEAATIEKYYEVEPPSRDEVLSWRSWATNPVTKRHLKHRTDFNKAGLRMSALSESEMDSLADDEFFRPTNGTKSAVFYDDSSNENDVVVKHLICDEHSTDNESSIMSTDTREDKDDANAVYESLFADRERQVIIENDDDQATNHEETEEVVASIATAANSLMPEINHDQNSQSSDSSGCVIIDEVCQPKSPFKNKPTALKSTSLSNIKKESDSDFRRKSSVPSQTLSSDSKRVRQIEPGARVLGLSDPYYNSWKLGRVKRVLVNNSGETRYCVEFDPSGQDNSETTAHGGENQREAGSFYKTRRENRTKPTKKKKFYRLDEQYDEDLEYENSDDDSLKANENDDIDDLFIFRAENAFLSSRKFKGSLHSLELDATSIAFLDNKPFLSPNDYLPNGARVVAYFSLSFRELSLNPNMIVDEWDEETHVKRELKSFEYMSSGTILSQPSSTDNYRYLVFFDNGCITYTKPAYVFPIVNMFELPKSRLHNDHVQFLQKYFTDFPVLNLVSLEKHNWIQVYLNQKWMPAQVVSVDALIVELKISHENIIEELKRSLAYSGQTSKRKSGRQGSSSSGSKLVYPEKLILYRGSYRLFPLYDRLIKNICSTEARLRLNALAASANNFNEYEKFVKDKYESPPAPSTEPKKYLSLFASSLFPKYGLIDAYTKKIADMVTAWRGKNNQGTFDPRIKQGDIRYLDLESSISPIISFDEHPCSNICVKRCELNINQVHGINPLLYPLLHGWQRHVSSQSRTLFTASKKWITYMAPCGRLLRSTGEVDRYLYLTDSKLTIDMFSFDSDIHVNREFEGHAKYLSIDDLTKGVEQMPISCVNCIDKSSPDDFVYSVKRVACEGVPLNTDESAMEGCGCTDNCRDRSKCACWRKTFEATLFANKEMNTKIGYRGRRLPEMLNTGIFECNSQCNCDCRCTNRVVQNGLKLRLQLYKTSNKGWGLRCLDDIPKGTFICVYNGELLTEEQSDDRGKQLGDEYFAELDFLDCLRRLKGAHQEQSNLDTTNEDDDSPQRRSRHAGDESGYQRPRLKQQKKPQGSGADENDCIFLDSDQDEQDIDESKNNQYLPNSADEERNRLKCQSRQESVNANRYFTSLTNKYFYRDLLRDESVYIMDAKLLGNIGRYFNHSCSPNIFVQNVFVDTYDLRFPWIAFFASQSIRAGTELCWDYNYTIDSVKNRKLYCYCGAANCRGRLL